LLAEHAVFGRRATDRVEAGELRHPHLGEVAYLGVDRPQLQDSDQTDRGDEPERQTESDEKRSCER
jgi:hypothetical protein